MTVFLRNTALPFQNFMRLIGPNSTQITLKKRVLLKECHSLRTKLFTEKNNPIGEQNKIGANSHNNAPKANIYNWKSGKLNSAGEKNNQKKRELLEGNFPALLASSLFSLPQPISLSTRNFTKKWKGHEKLPKPSNQEKTNNHSFCRQKRSWGPSGSKLLLLRSEINPILV